MESLSFYMEKQKLNDYLLIMGEKQKLRYCLLLILSVVITSAFIPFSKAEAASIKEAMELDRNGFYEEAIEQLDAYLDYLKEYLLVLLNFLF